MKTELKSGFNMIENKIDDAKSDLKSVSNLKTVLTSDVNKIENRLTTRRAS